MSSKLQLKPSYCEPNIWKDQTVIDQWYCSETEQWISKNARQKEKISFKIYDRWKFSHLTQPA